MAEIDLGEAIQRQIDQIKANFKACNAEILSVLEAESKAEDIAGKIEFGQWQAARVEELFREAVGEWYGAFTPEYYERTNSLYDVLEITFDSEGMVNTDNVDSLYNPGAMGDGLFDHVFKQGWHGGKAGSDHPHYRKPVGIWRYYSRPAVQSTAADVLFRNNLSGADGEMYQMFDSIARAHQDVAVQRVQAMVPSIQAKYFG